MPVVGRQLRDRRRRYVAVPVPLAAIAAWPGPAALRDVLWPAASDRRLALLAFVLPLLLPTVLAVASHEVVTSLWAIASMTLLPVVLLSSPRSPFRRLRRAASSASRWRCR